MGGVCLGSAEDGGRVPAVSGERYCPTCLTSFAGDLPRCSNLACRRTRPRAGWLALYGPGQTLDRHYRVMEVLAVGGAGVTYRCRELDADGLPQPPDLAVKVLHMSRSAGAFLQRLANEAQILQGLNNDHIVECLGFVQRRGHSPYLVTRFEGGGTLQDLVEELGPLPPWTVAGICRQVLEGLAMAHRQGVIHRDLKPANVLLRARVDKTEIPQIRVADFGIAKVSGGPGAGLTRAGFFIGTPQYAAPEQFIGQPATTETDVFSLGAVAMYLLTGEPHFEPPADADMAGYHQAVLRSLPPTLPKPLLRSRKGALIQRFLVGAMQPDPKERWTVARCIGWLDYVLDVRTRPPAKDPQARPEPGETQVFAKPLVVEVEEEAAGTRDPVAPPAAPLSGRTTALLEPEEEEVSEEAEAEEEVQDAVFEEVPAGEPVEPPPPASSPPPRRSPRPRVATPAPAPIARRTPASEGAIRGRQAAWRTAAEADVRDNADAMRAAQLARTTAPAGPLERGYVRPQAGPFRVDYSARPPWQPDPACPPPTELPEDAAELLRLMGAVAPVHRQALRQALDRTPAARLNKAILGHAPGGDPALGRGIGVFILDDPRRGWEPVARTLLSDPEPGVRCCAALALARVDPGNSLKTLGNLLRDDLSEVRIAAARAMVDAARATSKFSVASWLLRPARQDVDAKVQHAVELALMDLST